MSLSKLVDVVNLSRFPYTRPFKKSLGQPPHQSILHHRIERANHLLLSSRLSFGAIAQSLAIWVDLRGPFGRRPVARQPIFAGSDGKNPSAPASKRPSLKFCQM
jgi:hypothetical protein